MKIPVPAAVAALALLPAPAAPAAQPPAPARCTAVEGALDAWQASNGITLSAAVRSQVAQDYCAAADAITHERRTSRGQIADAAPAAVVAYFQPFLAPDATARTMSATLRSVLGVQGFSRPVIRPYGLIEMSYRQPLDWIELGGERRDPQPRFMLRVGRLNFAGGRGNRRICVGQATIVAGMPVTGRC